MDGCIVLDEMSSPDLGKHKPHSVLLPGLHEKSFFPLISLNVYSEYPFDALKYLHTAFTVSNLSPKVM